MLQYIFWAYNNSYFQKPIGPEQSIQVIDLKGFEKNPPKIRNPRFRKDLGFACPPQAFKKTPNLRARPFKPPWACWPRKLQSPSG